jgi:alanyl-tRNA synthetase
MDIRKEFLEYFSSKGHDVYSSMPLVPDDPTLLFTNAGMVQFKDIFTGTTPTPKNQTATSCQLCVRAGGKHNDLENVGYTARHHTLFEMLGNFSFGDYFKKDAIAYAWEFVTKNLDLPVDKLWVTIHDSDDEAYELWKEHVSEDRIKRFGDKDNFWSMGDTGACGPCSEIFYDQGAEEFSSDEDYLGGEGDRFLEIWNLVFMQYERDKDGNLNPLPKPSIDTGMGLERVQAIKEGKSSNYGSTLFMPIINEVTKMLNTTYEYKSGASYRVIADHLRAVSFMLSQGIMFDKEGRGYVLRRILRRAVRHGYLLGFKKPFLNTLVETLISIMGGHYSDLVEKKEFIIEQIKLEEERFFKTIDSGMELFNSELANTKETFSGEVAFKLYDTFGFPLDLTADMLREKNLNLDEEKFHTLMNEQKQRAKASWKGSGDSAKDGDFKQILEKYSKNTFVGYNDTKSDTKIVTLLDDEFKEVESLNNTTGWVMLENTPFYAESGGQCGDIGEITAIVDTTPTITTTAKVLDTKKMFELNISRVEVDGLLSKDMQVQTVVTNRKEVEKHHSATHLLQSALKKILGDTVSQAGSSNDSNRLRFDFTYPKAMSNEQIEAVESEVNAMIAKGLSNSTEELAIEDAKKKGAIAMFGEKYGEKVRVVDFAGESIEFCGGTHVNNSSEIGSFYITKESGVSAGVRRIEAVCGLSAIAYTKNFIKELATIQEEVKNKDSLAGIKKLKAQIKELKDELTKAQSNNKKELNSEMIGNTKLIVDVVESGELKTIVDELKNQNDNIAIMLFQPKGDKVMIVAGCKDVSLKAGEWIKNIAPILGGGGGGRPDFAQAGGKDASKLPEAIEKAIEFAKSTL